MIKRCIFCGRFYSPAKEEKKCKECEKEYRCIENKMLNQIGSFKQSSGRTVT